MAVSDTTLRNAKPKAKRYRMSVGENVYLEIMPTGLKVFRTRYLKHEDGKPAIYTIGRYPGIAQKEAREQAAIVKKLVSEGINPLDHKKKEQAAAKTKRTIDGKTFEAVARQWHTERFKAGKWKDAHAAKILTSFENDVFPAIGHLPIIDIDAPLLLEMMEPVVKRGAIETSKKLNQRIGAVFRFAIVRNIIKSNPADYIRDELPNVEVNHNPHLTPEQIPNFLDAIERSLARESTKIAILLTMHTLTRTSETRFAQWSEFDLDNQVWHIPGERMKTGKPHSIPLSSQVMKLLERLKEVTKTKGYLFTTTNPRKPMSENAMLNILYKAGYKGIITIHGLRGTASTILNEHKFRDDVVESALAHIDPNKIRAAYNHAQYFEERAVMMQHYSDYLDSLRIGANVISINSKTA